MTTSTSNLCETPMQADRNTRLQILAVGPWHEREFCSAKAEIENAAAWLTAAEVSQACKRLDSGEATPELILLAQSHLGRYRQQDIDCLQALAPLARIVVVAGSWCEGGIRTGPKLTGVLRLYWHEFTPWWKSAKTRFDAGLYPPWSLPLDSPQAGRYVPELNTDRPSLDAPVAISARDFSVYESLSAALGSHAIASVWVPPASRISAKQKIAAGIWDGGQLDQEEQRSLADFCSQARLHNATVVALLDYPRIEHIALAREASAAAVFGKPYVVEEIVAALFAK